MSVFMLSPNNNKIGVYEIHVIVLDFDICFFDKYENDMELFFCRRSLARCRILIEESFFFILFGLIMIVKHG